MTAESDTGNIEMLSIDDRESERVIDFGVAYITIHQPKTWTRLLPLIRLLGRISTKAW